MLRAATACIFSTSERPNVVWDRQFLTQLFTSKRASHHNGVQLFNIATSKKVRTYGALSILTSKCDSRHSGVHFLNISTSRVLRAWCVLCFAYFDLEMCFAPQWRAPFPHLNFQKCSEPEVLLTFLLGNAFQIFAPQWACTFSTSQLPKVLRKWCACTFWLLNVLAPHRRALFYLSSPQMAPYPPLERAYFSTLRGHKTLEKHSVSALIFFLLSLSLLSFRFETRFGLRHLKQGYHNRVPSGQPTNIAWENHIVQRVTNL